ncbi:hypothetical protein KFE25_006555 [Diacronema lutheri]|uniref:PUM-HD domain-containing protein n=1 Tax=Diacronema lutheri TaxID=2081491 RepID=A0A8J5XG63_DIALT|nr:hypothetical protein KFE25_006555 [Diacronema lutheri]
MAAPLSRGVLQALRAHLPASAVRESWLRRLREDDAARRQMVGRLARAPPADPSAIAFASDAVGSHLVQACLRLSVPAERAALISVLAPAAGTLARSSHGSFVLRAALELAPSAADRSALIAPLLPRCAELCATVHGAHVVHEALEHASAREREALVARLLAGPPTAAAAAAAPAAAPPPPPLVRLAAQTHGSLVAQRVLELASDAQRALAQRALLETARELAQSTPGSFVVSTALQHASAAEAQSWLARLLPHAAELAGSKAGVRALHACAEVSAHADEQVARATGLLAGAALEAAMRALIGGAGDGADGGARRARARERCDGDGADAAGDGGSGGVFDDGGEDGGARGADGVLSGPGWIAFPARALDARARRRAHELARQLGLVSQSVGEGAERRLIVRARHAQSQSPSCIQT